MPVAIKYCILFRTMRPLKDININISFICNAYNTKLCEQKITHSWKDHLNLKEKKWYKNVKNPLENSGLRLNITFGSKFTTKTNDRKKKKTCEGEYYIFFPQIQILILPFITY